jgi:hypothetical protein
MHLALLLVVCTGLFFGAKFFLSEENGAFGFDISQLPADQTALSGDFSVLIDISQTQTSSRYVTLSFSSNGNASKMSISNDPEFTYSSIENLQPSVAWDLCAFKDGITSPDTCAEGTYTVYVKFYTASGQSGPAVSDSIVFTTVVPEKKYKLVPEARFMDLNFDDLIDMSEWGFWQQNLGKTGENAADYNRDKVVDLKDLIMLMKYWKAK